MRPRIYNAPKVCCLAMKTPQFWNRSPVQEVECLNVSLGPSKGVVHLPTTAIMKPDKKPELKLDGLLCVGAGTQRCPTTLLHLGAHTEAL